MENLSNGMDTFTHQEIKEMERDVIKGNLRELARKNLWIRAFTVYNSLNYERLGLKCKPCYGKVLTFIKKLNNG